MASTRYKTQNPDKVQINKMNSRAKREYGAVGKLTLAGWLRAKAQAQNKCLRCGSFDNLTPDHIQPLSASGPNTDDNIQCLCFMCNSWKRDQFIDYRSS